MALALSHIVIRSMARFRPVEKNGLLLLECIVGKGPGVVNIREGINFNISCVELMKILKAGVVPLFEDEDTFMFFVDGITNIDQEYAIMLETDKRKYVMGSVKNTFSLAGFGMK